MKHTPFWDLDMIAIILVGLSAFFLALHHVNAAVPIKPQPRHQRPSRPDVRTVKLGDLSIAPIRITPGRSTILSFPTKPSKVILGNQGMFAVEYVESDLASAAIRAGAHGNLFVYLEGRRFAFDLMTVPAGGDSIVVVRDEDDQGLKVNIK